MVKKGMARPDWTHTPPPATMSRLSRSFRGSLRTEKPTQNL